MTNLADTLTMQIAQVIPCTEAEGPGKRFAIWFQGCPLRCPGCCNPEFLPFRGGQTKTVAEMNDWIQRTRDEHDIEGVTFLGGEPFAHAVPAVAIARTAKQLGLSVMTFSGFVIEELRAKPEPEIAELVALTDILVDGPYDRDKPDSERRWIGSTNQRIHFLTDRYHFDEQWRKKNTLEIRVVGREITVNGFPAKDAVGLWKGWKRKKPLPVQNLTPQPPSGSECRRPARANATSGTPTERKGEPESRQGLSPSPLGGGVGEGSVSTQGTDSK